MRQDFDGGFWIGPREAARKLGLPVSTLASWRTEDMLEGRGWPEPGRGGLRWRHFGRVVLYVAEDVDASVTARGEQKRDS